MSIRKIDANWDRTKEYLIRSLFQDLPPCSPILEEDESADSSNSRIRPRSVAPVRFYSPPSPLPPLIIETEPNRHDEPEDYYKQLEKRVLKYYNKLFIENRSDVSVSETSDEDITENLDNAAVSAIFERRQSFEEMDDDIDEDDDSQNDLDDVSAREMIDHAGSDDNLERRKSFEDMDDDLDKASIEDSFGNINDDSVENDSHIDLDDASDNTKKIINKSANQKHATTEDDANIRSVNETNDTGSSSEVIPKSTSDNEHRDSVSSTVPDGEYPEDMSTSSPPTEYSAEYRLVTFQADVHREDEEPPGAVYRLEPGDAATGRHFGVEDLAALEENDVPGIDLVIPEVEVMRTPRARASADSLHGGGRSPTPPATPRRSTVEERRLEANTESSSSNLQEDTPSTDFNIDFEAINRISTAIEDIEESSRSKRDSGTRKRRSSSSSVSSKRAKYVEAETQMSETDDRSVLKDIFVGRPLVCTLCVCIEHTCIARLS